MKFFATFTVAIIASSASIATADDVSYVDITTTPEVTTSMVSTTESTSTPYTTTTLSTSFDNQPNSTAVNGTSSSSHELHSFEGHAANHKVAAAGLGAAIGAFVIALL